MKPKIKIAQGGRGAMELLPKARSTSACPLSAKSSPSPASRSSARCHGIFRLRQSLSGLLLANKDFQYLTKSYFPGKLKEKDRLD
jgi:hypothetical protein